MNTALFDTCAVWCALFWQWLVQSEHWIEAKLAEFMKKN